MLSNTNELLLQRNGQPVAVLVTFDHFMSLKRFAHNNHQRLNSFSFGDEKIMDIVLISIAFGIGILCAFLAFYYLRKYNQKQSKMTDHVDGIENGPDKVHNKGDTSKDIMLIE